MLLMAGTQLSPVGRRCTFCLFTYCQIRLNNNCNTIMLLSNEKSCLINNFAKYSTILQSSQDKYERIFKTRRDITIESKRIIFLLHSNNKDSQKVLAEAEERLKKLVDRDYKKIAQELKDEDPYRYFRAISPGNQEFIEALSFLEYLQFGGIKGIPSSSDIPFLPAVDYVLGLADLTGELMRYSVASIYVDNGLEVRKTRHFMRQVYSAMMGLTAVREIGGKLTTMEASLCKVERVCYNLHILGSEVPGHILACVNVDDQDEGFD